MTTDPKWSAALFHLCALWNTKGPDKTLAGLELLRASEVTDEGLLVLKTAPREKGREPLWAAAERAYAEGRIGPLPRMPSVRPESDYEMNLPGMPAAGESASEGEGRVMP